MLNKRVLTVLGAFATIAALIFMARYARQTGEALMSPAEDAEGRPTVRFVSNPQPLPGFTLRDVEGRQLGAEPGKVTLLNFWATWCPPCRVEVPDLIALQKKYEGQVQVIGVADDASADVVREFAGETGMNYPNALMTAEMRKLFAVRAIPTTYIVDTKGRVVQKHVGLTSPTVIEREIDVLLGRGGNTVVETFEDTGQVSLANTAHATDIPGLDLAGLSDADRTKALARLNTDLCSCGCALTLASCRINDTACDVSLPLARKVVEAIAGKRGESM